MTSPLPRAARGRFQNCASRAFQPHILTILALWASGFGFGQECSEWQWLNPEPQPNDLHAVSLSPNGIIACGNRGYIIEKTGGTWTVQSHLTHMALYGIAASPTTTVAVGDAGTLVYRTGLDWSFKTLALNGGNGDLRDVCYGNGKFVLAGRSGTIATSMDGIDWVSQTSGTGQHLNGVFWDGSQYWALGDSGTLLKSSDAISWQTVNSGTNVPLHGMAFGNGTWVAVGDNSRMVTSTDGTTFSEITVLVNSSYRNIHHNGSQFIAAALQGKAATSEDGAMWATHQAPTSVDLNDIVYSDSAWTAVGGIGTILRGGGTPADWTSERGQFTGGAIHTLAKLDGTYYLSDSAGILYSSQDLEQWTPQIDDAFYTILASATDGEKLVYATSFSYVLVLTAPGQTQLINLAGNDTLRGIAYGTDLWVTVGDNGVIFSSEDALLWTARMSMTSQRLRAVSSNGSQFVAVGDAGTIVYSENGTTWNEASTPTSQRLSTIAWNGSFYLAGGSVGTLLKSTDGITWNLVPLPFSTSFQGISFGNAGWMGAFIDGTVRTSPDGTSWTLEALGFQFSFQNTFQEVGRVFVYGNSGTLASKTCDPCTPPAIQSMTNILSQCAGDALLLQPAFTGSEPLTFSWFRDGQLLAENGPTLEFEALTGADSGTYALRIENACGEATQEIATIAVADPFGLTLPVSALAKGLCPVTILAETTCGSGSFTYEWWLDDLSGIFSAANPLILDPLPPDTLNLVLIVTDTSSQEQQMRPFTFLASAEQIFQDFNQDGANDLQDLLDYLPNWGSSGPDANADGQVDVLDLLYINTSGNNFCLPKD